MKSIIKQLNKVIIFMSEIIVLYTVSRPKCDPTQNTNIKISGGSGHALSEIVTP